MTNLGTEALSRLRRMYFGTPFRAAVFTGALVAYVAFGFYYVERRRTHEFIERISEKEQLSAQLLKALSTSPGGLAGTFGFSELTFEQPSPELPPSLAQALRSVDYAVFALKKADYVYAGKQLDEADASHPTMVATYYRGVLSFQLGDYASAEKHWAKLPSGPGTQNDEIRAYRIVAALRGRNPELLARLLRGAG